MTSKTRMEGAASAALSITIPDGATIAQIDRMEQAAYDAIDNVQDPDAAELLLRQVTVADHAVRLAKISKEREQRWGELRLRAERRYGELLGPARERGRPTGNEHTVQFSDSQRMGAGRARKVAAVPEDVFDGYLADTPKPTREGLFETASPTRAKPRPKNTNGSPLDATTRLRGRIKELRGLRAQRRHWTEQDMDDVQHILDNPTKRRPKYSGKRLRELAVKRQNGNELAGLQYRMMQLTSILESVDVASYDLADAEDVSDFNDDLVELRIWMETSMDFASSRLDDAALEQKIRKLRDTTGRTEAEARTALVIADRYERRRRERHLTS